MGEKISAGNVLDADARAWSLSWQAATGRDFLAHPDLASRIRQRLIGAHRQTGRTLIDFVLMPGEIHAITRIDDGAPVGSIARSVSHVLSRWAREAQTLRGPVFAGPCHAEPIASLEELRREVRMLAWRPVHQGLCSTPTHYPHGVLRMALGLKAIDEFDAQALRSIFGDSLSVSRSALRSCIQVRPTEEEWRVWELTRGLQLPTTNAGVDSTKAMVRLMDAPAAMLIAAGGGYGIDGALTLLEVWVRAKIHPAGHLDLHRGSSMLAVRGRALVACLAVAHRLCSAAAVARHFQRAKSTLSEQMTLCRSGPTNRPILATPLSRILEEAEMLRS